MEKISIQTLSEAIGADYRGEDFWVEGISTDTRKIQKGFVFIAIEGERFDGHDFCQNAADAGAIACVCSKKTECTVPVLYVEDTGKAFLNIASYYRSLFSIPLVGITGSVGKTTTKEFVALALSARFKTLKTQGNLNNNIGVPTMLLELDNSFEAAVIEMGMNHFGEIRTLAQAAKPTMGVITNIGVSHIENLGSREGILKAKLEILDGLEPGSALLLNADNDMLAGVQPEGYKTYFFGIENERADFKAANITPEGEGTRFVIVYGEKSIPAFIPARGEHNVLNAVCAFAVGVLNGIEPAAIVQKLGQYEPAGRRQKIVDCGAFRVIEDCYNASPDSMRASIGLLAQLESDKKIAVLADMLELGAFSQAFHREVGAFAAEKGIDVLLGYGEAAAFYCEQAKKGGVANVQHFTEKDALLECLLKEIEPGSAVLFKGSHGMHLEQVIEKLYERKGIENE